MVLLDDLPRYAVPGRAASIGVVARIVYTCNSSLGGAGVGDKSPKAAEKKKKQKEAKKTDSSKKK